MRAHERFSIVGLAEEMMGATDRIVDGRVCDLGNITGETNFLRSVSWWTND